MVKISLEKIKNNRAFVDDIRWNVTPKIFLNPGSGPDGELVDITYGYMLYVDVVKEKAALVIMVLKPMVSKTAGYIYDIPGKMLEESLEGPEGESVAGMYPLSEKLELWLKTEFGVTG